MKANDLLKSYYVKLQPSCSSDVIDADVKNWLVMSNADKFNITRPTPKRSISFGHGPHKCLGQHLARLEGRVILEEIFKAIPEYTVVAMKRSNINAFTIDQAKEKFFKCKISYIANDPDSGKEKKVKEYILVQADDFDDATSKVDTRMEGTISDFEIDSISKTPIVDIIQRNA